MITFDCFVITQNGCWKIVLVNGLNDVSFVIFFFVFFSTLGLKASGRA